MNYNLSYDFCGIVILALLLLILQKIYVMNSESNKLFRKFVIVALIAAILDVVTAYTIGYAKSIPPVLNLILNCVYNFLQNYATFLAAHYAFSTVKFRSNLHAVVNKIIILVYGAMIVINLFTGILFDFDNGTYNKGVLYYYTFLTALLLVFHFAIVLIISHKVFSKKQLVLFSSFIISPILFVSYQIVQPDNLMTVFSTSIVALIMLFAVETPDFVELEYLRRNLEKEVQDCTADLKKANDELQTRTDDLKNANEELERKNRQAKQDMDLASHLQHVLYSQDFNYLGWDIAVMFEPLSGISGDLYDFYVLEGMLRGFGLFDVSGHGISSGFVTVLAKNAIFHEFRTTLPLDFSEAMKRINNSVIRIKGNIENYLTGVACRIDKDDSSKIELSNAGAPYPIYKAKGKISELVTPDADKPQYGMIGVEGLDVCFQTIQKTMSIGDMLVFYTDGITESENADGEQYGTERLRKAIDSVSSDCTAQEILDALSVDFKNFIGDTEVDDDITVMVIKRIEEDSVADVVEELENVE